MSNIVESNIFKAILDDNNAEITRILNTRFDIDSQDDYGNTALIYAVSKNNQKLVNELLEKGANPNIAAKNKTTPLGLSVNYPIILKKLLEKGANVNQIINDNQDTPLFAAIYTNKIPSILLLLKGGADVNHKNKSGTTPFLLSLDLGNYYISELMLKEYWADPNIEFAGLSPLLFVITSENPLLSLIKTLLSKGANPNYKEAELNRTALHLATLTNNHIVANTLMNAGADPFITDSYGKTSIDYARDYKMKAILNIPKNHYMTIVEPNSENSVYETIQDGNILAILDPEFQGQRLIVKNANGNLTPSFNYLINTKRNPVTRKNINFDKIQYKRAIIMPSSSSNNKTGGKRKRRNTCRKSRIRNTRLRLNSLKFSHI